MTTETPDAPYTFPEYSLKRSSMTSLTMIGFTSTPSTRAAPYTSAVQISRPPPGPIISAWAPGLMTYARPVSSNCRYPTPLPPLWALRMGVDADPSIFMYSESGRGPSYVSLRPQSWWDWS